MAETPEERKERLISEERARLRTFDTAQRREWLIDKARTDGWLSLRTHGRVQELAALFGVHRDTIGSDLKLILPRLQERHLDAISADMLNTLDRANRDALKQLQRSDLRPGERANLLRAVTSTSEKITRLMEAYGLKDREMAPPPKPVEAVVAHPDEDRLARELAQFWDSQRASLPKDSANPPGAVPAPPPAVPSVAVIASIQNL